MQDLIFLRDLLLNLTTNHYIRASESSGDYYIPDGISADFSFTEEEWNSFNIQNLYYYNLIKITYLGNNYFKPILTTPNNNWRRDGNNGVQYWNSIDNKISAEYPISEEKINEICNTQQKYFAIFNDNRHIANSVKACINWYDDPSSESLPTKEIASRTTYHCHGLACCTMWIGLAFVCPFRNYFLYTDRSSMGRGQHYRIVCM